MSWEDYEVQHSELIKKTWPKKDDIDKIALSQMEYIPRKYKGGGKFSD